MFGALYFGQGYIGMIHIETKPKGLLTFYTELYVPQNTIYTDLYIYP